MGDWRQHAACRGTPLAWWFPGDKSGCSVHPKAVERCASCPVRFPCLEDALSDRHFQEGTRAGFSTAALRRLRRQRRASRAVA